MLSQEKPQKPAASSRKVWSWTMYCTCTNSRGRPSDIPHFHAGVYGYATVFVISKGVKMHNFHKAVEISARANNSILIKPSFWVCYLPCYLTCVTRSAKWRLMLGSKSVVWHIWCFAYFYSDVLTRKTLLQLLGWTQRTLSVFSHLSWEQCSSSKPVRYGTRVSLRTKLLLLFLSRRERCRLQLCPTWAMTKLLW